jgi:hypothetical protein
MIVMGMDISVLQSEGLLERCQLDQSQEVSLEEALDELSIEKSYEFFDLSMSPEESNFLQTISVEKSDQVDFFLNPNTVREQYFTGGLESFLHGISEKNKDISAQAIHIIQKELSSILDQDEGVFVLIRSQLGARGEQSAEKHQDPSTKYYLKKLIRQCEEDREDLGLGDCAEEELWNFTGKPYTEAISISLKGEKTIFADMTYDERKSFHRGKLVTQDIEVSGFNQGAAFVFDRGYGAVHARPIFLTPRIMMLVLLGDEVSLYLSRSYVSDFRDANYFEMDEYDAEEFKRACRKALCMNR